MQLAIFQPAAPVLWDAVLDEMRARRAAEDLALEGSRHQVAVQGHPGRAAERLRRTQGKLLQLEEGALPEQLRSW